MDQLRGIVHAAFARAVEEGDQRIFLFRVVILRLEQTVWQRLAGGVGENARLVIGRER